MYICYIDESGTPEIPGTTSHFILAGLSIPITNWHECDQQITKLLAKYELQNEEIHTAWMMRKYIEQKKIAAFDNLDWNSRRSAVMRERTKSLLQLQKIQNRKAYRQAKKNYRHTEAYIHLTFDERVTLVEEIADLISDWGNARLFAECIDKTYFDPSRGNPSSGEQAFEQVLSRFQNYLSIAVANGMDGVIPMGILVHDNNQSVAKKHTELMRNFRKNGTLWTKIDNIIETPLFVDSQLTRMVQVADLCSYSIRRYLENGEETLFKKIFQRADRNKGKTVGVRHFSSPNCSCMICKSH